MAIQMRRGLRADFDPYKMLPGEWAVSIDPSTSNQIVWMCFEPGVCKRMGTYEDFAEQVKEATADVKTEYSEEFNTILNEVKTLSNQVSSNKNTVVSIKTDIQNTYLPQIQKALSDAQSKAESAKNSAEAAAVSEQNAKASEENAKKYAENVSDRMSDIALNKQTLGYNKKNLLKVVAVTNTSNGITYTVNADKSITANGTATADSGKSLGTFKPTPNMEYIFTANEKVPTDGLWNNACYIKGIDASDVWFGDSTGKNFIPKTNNPITCHIYIKKGTTVNNLTFYPMIRSADITDATYEPYVDDVDKRLDKIDNSILNTLEEIEANTDPDMIASALAVKELYNLVKNK